MNIKMKKLACFAGVLLAYFSIFFFGQIKFSAPGEPIIVRLQIPNAQRSNLLSNMRLNRDTKQSTKSKSELFFKTSE